jgi:hypothetical protein
MRRDIKLLDGNGGGEQILGHRVALQVADSLSSSA